MAERSIETEMAPARAEAWSIRVAAASFSLLPWAALLAGFILVLAGQDGIGYISAVVGLLAAAPQISWGIRRSISGDSSRDDTTAS